LDDDDFSSNGLSDNDFSDFVFLLFCCSVVDDNDAEEEGDDNAMFFGLLGVIVLLGSVIIPIHGVLFVCCSPIDTDLVGALGGEERQSSESSMTFLTLLLELVDIIVLLLIILFLDRAVVQEEEEDTVVVDDTEVSFFNTNGLFGDVDDDGDADDRRILRLELVLVSRLFLPIRGRILLVSDNEFILLALLLLIIVVGKFVSLSNPSLFSSWNELVPKLNQSSSSPFLS